MNSPKLLALGLTILLLTALSAAPALAQTTAPTPTVGGPTAPPAPTRTPAPTATATPTFTALQTKLALAQVYLKGGDHANAARLFSEVAAEDRGNAAALAGLAAALEAQAKGQITPPAPTPVPAKREPAPSFASTFARQWSDLGSVALAGLILLLVVYVLAKAARQALYWSRELWLTRILPALTLKPVKPPYLLGDFVDATKIENAQGASVVSQALAEQLVRDNEAVAKWENTPIEAAPSLELGAMAWIRVLWSWIMPPPRGYKLNGVLLAPAADTFQLAAQRVELVSNRIDASHTFTQTGGTVAQAARLLAAQAARWARDPAGYEALLADRPAVSTEAAAGPRRGIPRSGRGAEESLTPAPPPPGDPLDLALENLRAARRLSSQGPARRADALAKAAEAEEQARLLPVGSSLRSDLEAEIEALRAALQKAR
jgi:hypothetical protein